MRKTDLGRVGPALRVLLAGLAILTAAAPATAREESTRSQWNRPIEPYRVAGSVYQVGVKGIASYLIATPDGHILIDGGFEETAPIILANVRALGFKPIDVKYLVITHAHNDHAGGLAGLKAATGGQLLALEAERRGLEEGRHDGEFNYDDTRFAPVGVDRIIRDGETIRLGGAALTAHWTPGHTKGCTSFTLPLVEAGRNHTAIFYCSTTVAGNRLVGNRTYPTIVAEFRRTFARLKTLRADIFLPNHPSFARLEEKRLRVASGRANPFIDAGELQRHVASSERAFEAELARQAGGR